MNKQTDIEVANLPHLASRVFDTPLMISKPKLEIILSVLGPRFGLDVPAVKSASVGPAAHNSFKLLESGAAIIPVLGSLVHRTSGLDAMSGLTSYASISQQFEAALENNAVTSIIFDIDSPGGEASTVFDLSDQIFNARGEKPITAIINDQGYSSAYAIASAADNIYLSRTGGAGSIGVIAAHLDQSKKDQMDGVNITTVFAGDRKNDFNTHEKLSSEAMQILTDNVFEIYGIFVETVARNRGITTAAVRNTQAAFYIGKSAVKANLADGVMSASEAFEKAANANRRVMMSGSKQKTAMLAACLTAAAAKLVRDDYSIDTIKSSMATDLGVDLEYIDTLMTGVDSAPDAAHLKKLAAGLGISQTDIFAAALEDGFKYEASSEEPGDGEEEEDTPEDPAPEPEASSASSNVISIETARDQGALAAKNELMQRAAAINEMCALAGMAHLAGGMISRGIDLDAARKELFTAKAAAEATINSLIDGQTSNGLQDVGASWDAAFDKIHH